MNTASSKIRTVALVGHGAAGKTTLAESLLAASGAISSRGSVERGNTLLDFDPLEKEFGHSLHAAMASFQWGGAQVHLIDTPGYPDFMGQAIGALAAGGAPQNATFAVTVVAGLVVVETPAWVPVDVTVVTEDESPPAPPGPSGAAASPHARIRHAAARRREETEERPRERGSKVECMRGAQQGARHLDHAGCDRNRAASRRCNLLQASETMLHPRR